MVIICELFKLLHNFTFFINVHIDLWDHVLGTADSWQCNKPNCFGYSVKLGEGKCCCCYRTCSIRDWWSNFSRGWSYSKTSEESIMAKWNPAKLIIKFSLLCNLPLLFLYFQWRWPNGFRICVVIARLLFSLRIQF